MTTDEFTGVLENRINKMRNSLIKKRGEYAKDTNVFHNFHRASAVLQTYREQALMGMAVKHFVSILDIVDNLGDQFPPTEEVVSEKIGDMINYLVILEAMLYEQNKLPF
jgi:hypothetical protein